MQQTIAQKRADALELRSASALGYAPVTFNVAGISFCPGNCATLVGLPHKQPRVVKLKPEHDNLHDPHAIAVMVNDLHIGYVPKELTGRVRSRHSLATPPQLVDMKRFKGRHGGSLMYATVSL